MENKKRNTLVGVITAIILILIVVGVIGLVYSLTNGFTEDFKTFAVEYESERLPLTGKKLRFRRGSENTFTVNYVFDAPNTENKDYTVKIMAGGERDFGFKVDEKRYSWLALGEITSAFTLKKEATSFTLTIPKDFSTEKVLSALYKGKTVQALDSVPDEYIYTLVISSYNDTATYTINFSILNIGVQLSDRHIIF